MSTELLASLARLEENLSARHRETSSRLTQLEQAHSASTDAAVRELQSELNGGGRGAASSVDRASQIIKVHNSRGISHIVGCKARVTDALPKPEKVLPVSLGRFLAAGLLGDKCGDGEALRAAAEVKTVTTGTSGLVIPVQYQGEWIDLLRANLVLNAAGVRTVPMADKSASYAAQTADPTAGWHTEATADITATDPTFAARTLTAQTLAVRCTASVEATMDSPDFGNQLALAMAKAIAVEIDRVGLVGTGTPPQPRGILNVSGIGSVATVGTVTSYGKILQGVQLLLEANVPLETATKVAIMSPRTWGRYENLATGIASDLSPLPRPRALENMQFLVTTSIPNTMSTDKSALFLGDFADLVLGIRTDVTFEALKLTTFATSLIIEFIAYTRVDFLATRPASFAVLTGIS